MSDISSTPEAISTTTAPPSRPAAPRRATTTTPGGVVFRAPNLNPPGFTAPPLGWLGGTWYFTHSTLPIWKDKRNVKITYTVFTEPQPPSQPAAPQRSSWYGLYGSAKPSVTAPLQQRLDDVVEYQEYGSDRVKQVRGREYTTLGSDTRAWDWRGKGIIKVASSHWEILGWGIDDGRLVPDVFTPPDGKENAARDENGDTKDRTREYFMVTYFIKTVFTPAALDFYSTSKEGLSERTVQEILRALGELGDPEIDRLVRELYVCKHDNGPVGKVESARS